MRGARGRAGTRADAPGRRPLDRAEPEPDGYAAGTRGNARGVDLNRCWPVSQEREIRIARRLILRLRPRATIWFHQHMDLVWAWGGSTAAGRVYARAAGMRLYHHPWVEGSGTEWQNRRLPGTAAITVELPAGRLSPAQVRAQMRAVLAVARRMPSAARPRSSRA